MAQPEPGGEYHAPGWGSVILSFFYGVELDFFLHHAASLE